MSKVKARSNAKIILIGEHSVVYGKPAIALPFFAAEITALIEENDDGILIKSELFNGKLKNAPPILDGIRQLVDESLSILKIEDKNIKISLKSTIPSQRGFGSSAAVSVAIAKALFTFADQTLNSETLTKLVTNAEKIHHQNPSGLDGDTIISRQSIYFVKGKENIQLTFGMDLDLIVADTGIPASTKEAVQIVSNNLNKERYIEDLGILSELVLKNIAEKDAVNMGINLSNAHKALQALGVSTKRLDLLVEQAIITGALGAKLSGGGLGGCMIALSKKDKTENIIKTLKKHGAQSTWILDLKEI